MKMSKTRAAFLGALCFACSMFAGCNRGPAMYHVRGKVLYKDGSVPRGMGAVHFEPTSESTAAIRKVASGDIGPDGSFELMTRKPGDGVFRGEYVATIAVVKSATDPTLLSAETYRNAKTTPFPPITIDHNISDLKFEIEPSIGAPKNSQ
jgi:hypothetical protein